MDVPANTFKRAIYAGRQQIGLWSSLANHLSVEILAGSGFDWLLIDTEHSPNELPQVVNQLHAMMEYPATQPIVRPPVNDTVVIKRFLDAGVQSFLIPMVDTPEQATAAVAATRYPPHGVRGFASASRASRYGRVSDYYARAHEEICVLVQIESRLGLDHLDAIAAVPGVDGVFIGPGDLSAALGHLGGQGDAAIVTLIEDMIGRIGKAGNRAGILTGDETLARRYIAAGCVFTAVGSDVGILARGSEALAKKFRS
ncbi:HpcH/HpaI aldolase family protein [Xanthobacter tagetidis]|uniref:2-dehydro-3-deoxyglucarate aldolase n=1 Tax=Xanthobacter tagetidis TaxID=60216 RepID=A0A3L7ALB0_9HYPH|nr:HpcH/HpaI aldolase/citrate lyase family protein [Xanthobacter tagetidis]MBB6307659.1 4-hydroxy-2-oxoheptanedioate aldolase [Xanthobacter tagetidis]RLP81219.1 2-dehydro-3-deoxyglucarate aldolase [Xanthobacter tagetidis]